MSRYRRHVNVPPPDTLGMPYEGPGPVPLPEGPPVVHTAVQTALGEAGTGRMSGAQAGDVVQAGRLPTPVFETPNAFAYLRDLVPDTGLQNRSINLHTTDDKSSTMGLSMSYIETSPDEPWPAVLPAEPPWGNAVPARDHASFARFGTGSAQHNIEFDCGEGNAINIPGSTVEVTLIDWTFYRLTTQLFGTVLPQLSSFCHAYSRSIPGQSTFTTRVMTFYQVDLDLLAPPTVQGMQTMLIQALTRRTLLD
ncbi:MAG: hypothetical protein B7733_18650 [Myxococcales bacterium FL481]|nr:MAG: hypothetical protein B7733_18650 [Myxococcales bacterium FL481]